MPELTSKIGALFDWDGVVIDSQDQHEKSWKRIAQELDVPLPGGFFEATFGMRNEQIIPDHLGWAQPEDREKIAMLGARKEELYRELILRDGIEPLPGVIGLLEELKQCGVPCAVGSSTPRENIDAIMNVIGASSLFQSIVAAADVAKGKPEPDVFLMGAEKIARPPERCIVFEDAHVGLEAAKRARCKTIAVATTNPLEDLDAADLAVASLEEVNVERMVQLFL